MSDGPIFDVIDGMRHRPAMYCRDTGVHGLHDVVFGAVEMACEEVINGHATWINLTIHDDGSLEMEFDGRAVSVSPIPEFGGRSRFEIAFTHLEGDGRFDAMLPLKFGFSRCGHCLMLNALSEWLTAEMEDGEAIWQIQFQSGRVSVPLHRRGDSQQRAIRIRFRPDRSIFRTTEIDFVLLRSRCQELAAFDPRIKFRLQDQRQRDLQIGCPTGVADLVARLNRTCEPAYSPIVSASAKSGVVQVHFAFQHVIRGAPPLLSYCNGRLTREGGTHLKGFQRGLARAVNHGQTEKTDRLKVDQLLKSMTLVLCVWLPDAHFEGPTRNCLSNHEIERTVETLVFQHLRDRFAVDQALLTRIRELARSDDACWQTTIETIVDTVLFRD